MRLHIQNLRLKMFAIYFKTNIQNSFVLVYFVCHTPQFKTLVFAFQKWNLDCAKFQIYCFRGLLFIVVMEISIFTRCNHAKVQSKTNKYCKFHVDLTRKRLSRSRFKKLGMVPQKLYRNTLKKSWTFHSLCRCQQFPGPFGEAVARWSYETSVLQFLTQFKISREHDYLLSVTPSQS